MKEYQDLVQRITDDKTIPNEIKTMIFEWLFQAFTLGKIAGMRAATKILYPYVK